MEFSPRAAELTKRLSSFVLVTFSFWFLCVLHKEVAVSQNIVASSGGGAALYFLFGARSYLARVTTLYAFVMSSGVLYIVQNALEPDLGILMLLTLSATFYVSFFFHSNISLDRFFGMILILFLTLIGLEWAMAFLVELNILFVVQFLRDKHIKKKEIWLSVSLLLPICICLHLLGGHTGFRMELAFLFGAAGAGGLLFLCLNKTDWEQAFGLLIYIWSNLLLGGLLLQKEALPKIPLLFLMTFLVGLVFVYLVSRIKEESLSSVLTGSKPLLRGVFFPLLYLLNDRFLDGTYGLWITSFVIHVLILLLFKCILQTEEQDPILENEEKGRR